MNPRAATFGGVVAGSIWLKLKALFSRRAP